ncbi:MAG: DUF3887 domain-containing protein [Flavobacteriales bacterium]|nr:DUF3887 domain-containing protein [Flavobacteriales bacterium]
MKVKILLLNLFITSTSLFSYAQSIDKIKVNKEYLNALNNGNYVKACEFMDTDLIEKKQVTPKKLEKVWTKFASKYGKLIDIDSTETSSTAKTTDIYTYAKLDNGTAFLVTTFDKNDRIIGIHAYHKKRYKAEQG